MKSASEPAEIPALGKASSASPPSRPEADGATPSRRRIVFAWTTALAWAFVVWRLGGDDYSATQTNSIVVEWLSALFSDLDTRTRYRLLIGIRKAAHFIEYAILAILTFRAAWISAGRNQRITAVWVALLIVAILASADEARQAFSPVRTGSHYDVLLDLSGGVIAVGVLLLISLRFRGQTSSSEPGAGLPSNPAASLPPSATEDAPTP